MNKWQEIVQKHKRDGSEGAEKGKRKMGVLECCGAEQVLACGLTG